MRRMPEITDERISKLPRWAQDELARLEREVQGLREEVASITGTVDSSVTIRDRGYLSERRSVDERAVFEWTDPKGRRMDVTVRANGLKVTGDGRLTIWPQASNVVRVSLGKD